MRCQTDLGSGSDPRLAFELLTRFDTGQRLHMSSGADLNSSTPAVPFSARLEILLSKQSRHAIVDAGS